MERRPVSDVDLEFTISQVAATVGIPLNRLKTLRFRGMSPMWDNGDDGKAGAWRKYSLIDIALLAAQLSLMNDGLSAEAACELVRDARAFLREERAGDVWAGLIKFEDGERHVGGSFHEVLAASAMPSADSQPRAAFLTNLTFHARRVRAALETK